MIQVSETAKKKVVDLMTEEGFDATTDYVRVGVKSGGCSGLSYELNFDKAIADTDKVFEDNNVRIIVDKKKFFVFGGHGVGIFRGPQWQRLCVQQSQCPAYLRLWGEFFIISAHQPFPMKRCDRDAVAKGGCYFPKTDY